MNNLKINIWTDYGTDEVNIVVIDYAFRPVKVLNLYTGIVYDHKEGDTIRTDFIMKIPRNLGQDFLKAFAEALDDKGVKTENDFKIAGLLEATKYHLEDMRTIALKLKGG